MKQITLTFALLMLLFTAAQAQVEIGVKAGGMLSQTSVLDPDSLSGMTDAKISYLLGGFVNIPISASLSVQPELLYANKGHKNFYQHYLNLPIMLQYHLTDRLKLEAGPEVGYLLATYYKTSFGTNHRRNDLNRFDLGINFGLDYALLEKLNVGLRYNMGIIDSYDPNQPRFNFGTPVREYDYNIQNRTIQLSVGWKF